MTKRTKPTVRVVVERSSNNEKRQLRTPVPSDEERQALCLRLKYEGSAKHKLVPRAFGLEPVSSDADDTYCDGHADFTPEDMPRVIDILKRGVEAGLFGHLDKQGDPTVLWSVDDNGWVYEARITTPTQALYHGYPLLVGDAFAKKVIARYRDWAYEQDKPELIQTFLNAQKRYR